ncbi:MAG: hypothetical protein LIP77_03285 [Planctomycetes bacterium]|nr:hypothetical protein [Planctomycetota bacterium]
MAKAKDVTVDECAVYFLPVRTRMPLVFGGQTVERVTCVRIRVTVHDGRGRTAEGWGETPLNVPWLWPGAASHGLREAVLLECCRRLARVFPRECRPGHPMEIGHRFLREVLPDLCRSLAAGCAGPVPWLAALGCFSAFDIAVHDAYARLHRTAVYATYTSAFMNRDLAWYYGDDRFAGRYPSDFLVAAPPLFLPAWHLVGGGDPVTEDELTGREPDDGYPVLLREWMDRDGVFCLKVKLRGTDAGWDYHRLVKVGNIAAAGGAKWLCADFNCQAESLDYVSAILHRLAVDTPEVLAMLLYVEQPFQRDLDRQRLAVDRLSRVKPLFLDESADDWQQVELGRRLGWTGVALKTCKTQTGALLSLCWARAHGMAIMVQDLTNPMLAQVPHVRLAAHAGTIMGVETNAMQFYPEASRAEAAVHPGLYRRRQGGVHLGTLGNTGFGYREDAINRVLPAPEAV